MDEFEQKLEEALTNMEFDCLTSEDIEIIRHACGKPRSHKAESALHNIFEDFATIFGGNNGSK